MQMEYRLSGCRKIVLQNMEAAGSGRLHDGISHLLQRGNKRGSLFFRKSQKIFTMSFGNHERMPFSHGSQIQKRKNRIIFVYFGTWNFAVHDTTENALTFSHAALSLDMHFTLAYGGLFA